MAAPQSYDRQFGFTAYQAQHPSLPLPGDEVDAELNAIKASMDETQAALALIQRSDGQLQNASVGAEQMKPELSTGVAPAIPWETGVEFAENASAFYDLGLYRCITAHTAGVSFDPTKFVLLADLSSIAIPPGAVDTTQLADEAVDEDKIAPGAVTPAKIGSVTGQRLLGRYSNTTGALQNITLDPADFVLNTSTGVLSLA